MNAVLVQNVLVTLIVAISALVALRRAMPNSLRRLQSRLARSLGQPRRQRWIRAIGRRLQPREARQGGCGSGSGCASCSGCVASRISGDSIILQPRQDPTS